MNSFFDILSNDETIKEFEKEQKEQREKVKKEKEETDKKEKEETNKKAKEKNEKKEHEDIEKYLKKYNRVIVKVFGAEMFTLEGPEVDSISIKDILERLVNEFDLLELTAKKITWLKVPNKEKTEVILTPTFEARTKG